MNRMVVDIYPTCTNIRISNIHPFNLDLSLLQPSIHSSYKKTMSTSIRTVECKYVSVPLHTSRTKADSRYNGCGKLFTSKPRMKEHVLWHLETDPPERVHQHAIVQYRPDGSWTVIRDLSPPRAEGSGGEAGPSQVDSEIEKFRIAGTSTDHITKDDSILVFSFSLGGPITPLIIQISYLPTLNWPIRP